MVDILLVCVMLQLMLISPVQQQRDREQNLVQERQRHPGNHSKSKEHHGAPRETTSGSKIDVLQIQLGNCKDELSSAQKTLEEVREENKALKANLEGLKADLNDLAKRNENYRKEVQKKDVENGNLLYR